MFMVPARRLAFALTFALASCPLAVGFGAVVSFGPAIALGAERMGDRESVKACQQYYNLIKAPVRIEFPPPGPRVLLPSLTTGTRDFNAINELKVSTYNVLNLEQLKGKFVYDKRQGRTVQVAPARFKPEEELRGVADTIRRTDSDILFLQEVESLPALEALVRDRLGGAYRIMMVDGNDERGIDIAVLVKKDLPFDLELQSYRNVEMKNQLRGGREELAFSRDLPVLTVRKKGSREPIMDFVGTHFKSQRDAAGDDGSIYKRTEQAKAAAKIIGEVRARHPGIPMVFLGDTNTDVRSAKELAPIWNAGFRDALEATGKRPEERITQTYHPRREGEKPGTWITEPTVYSQLDTVAIAEGNAKGIVKKAEVIPYLDASGKPKPPPDTYAQRKENPSDHRMVQVTLDFKKIRDSLRR